MEATEKIKDEFVRRCEKADLAYELLDVPGLLATVQLPQGRESREVVVNQDTAQDLIDNNFENYVFLGHYQAICSYEAGDIEVLLEVAGSGAAAGPVLSRRFQEDESDADGMSPGDTAEFFSVAGPSGVSLSVGRASPLIQAMVGWDPVGRAKRAASLRIQGLTRSRHDTALAAMETIGNGLLFQLDSKLDLPILLRRQPRRRFRRPRRISPAEVEFPASEFDPEPMSLFWYGRGAEGLPLLQFFAYYQVLEFYFGQFAEQEARRRVRSLLKDPGFSPHHDRDIGKVVRVASRAAGQSLRDERAQLRATIRGCADADDLRGYLTESDRRTKFFETKQSELTDVTIRPVISDSDLLERIAERIYDIRCRIVHTKDEGGKDEVGLLLPFSPAARKLTWDINLLERIARQALIHASRPLAIDT